MQGRKSFQDLVSLALCVDEENDLLRRVVLNSEKRSHGVSWPQYVSGVYVKPLALGDYLMLYYQDEGINN